MESVIGSMETVTGNSPRTVVRGVNSHKVTEAGVHWLRITFPNKHLQNVKDWIGRFYGESDQVGFGFWGYDCRHEWANGSFLLYDNRDETRHYHNDRCAFECQGVPCDELSPSDLILLMEGLLMLDGRCSRIDVFLDDFRRVVSPCDLHEIIEKRDFTRFIVADKRQTFKSGKLIRDEVTFGTKGKNGSGKSLTGYDKELESDGDRPCIRWELRLTDEKAHNAFVKLAGTVGNIEAFGLICGSLVIGSILFVHRTGDKNISRLETYDFWDILSAGLADLRLRNARKQQSIIGVLQWAELQTAANMSLIYESFENEEQFFLWLREVIADGKGRWSAKHKMIIKQAAKSLHYRPKADRHKTVSEYENMLNRLSNLQ
jgi:hypothetical protein